MATYKVNSIQESNICVSGKGDSDIWDKAAVLTSFKSPWNTAPVKQITFKAVHNSESVFFQFKVDDESTHIHPSEDEIDSINNSDRVELFFKENDLLDPYYCLEIDSRARIMDFKARPNKVFDFNWNWPSNELTVKSSVNTSYFIVEIAISIQSLKDLKLLKNNRIETGIYRAKYNLQEDNTFEPTWITWIDPNTESPNFHIASSFGVLELEGL